MKIMEIKCAVRQNPLGYYGVIHVWRQAGGRMCKMWERELLINRLTRADAMQDAKNERADVLAENGLAA